LKEPYVDKIPKLTEQLQAHLKAASDIAAAAETEGRDYTADERARLQELIGKASEVKAKLAEAKADEQMRQAVSQLGEGIALNPPQGSRKTPSGLIVPDGSKSIGQHFVASKAYADLLASAPNGQFGEKMRVQSAPVGYKTLITGTSDSSAGALIQEDWRGLQVGAELFPRPLRLRDVVSPGTTTSDTIEYARVTGFSNTAAPVPEATETGGTSGIKPESGFTTTRVSTPVRTIAHWMPATKRALADAAQVRTLIDNFLAYGLEEELEDQMISGDGTGENFEGLAHIDGIQTQPWQGDEPVPLLATLRKAKTKVRVVGRSMANAYLLHPDDVERVDLLQDNEGRFYFGGPTGPGTAQVLWGLPVIETEAVPAGTGYVGDFRKAVLWDREQASITVTDSHADFFIRNMVAILAESRSAFGLLQPSAIARVALTA
jgi:HK97 family phage major capsid protein